jgi:hypothetical protein
MRWGISVLLMMLSLSVSAITVTLQGEFHQPGAHELPQKRLLHAVVTGMPTERAYYLGGALMRISKASEQARQKQGILFDLEMMYNNYYVQQRPELRDAVVRLQKQVKQMPATGRVIPAEFNPIVLRTKFPANLALKHGDVIYLPPRPNGVRVLGAMEQPGWYRFKEVRLHQALKKIKRVYAQTDWAWLIQPDGRIEKIGVGLWNNRQTKILVPGATIFVPFAAKVEKIMGADINKSIAEWLGTQVITNLP